MDADLLERWRHDHVFLGAQHGTHERRTWAVVALTTVMMIAEIGGGAWSGSMALIADGLHMSTHVAALSIAALAYSFARRHVGNDWFSFGTGKIGELAAFASAVILAMVALLIGYELVMRVIHPVTIAFREAIPIALLGLGVNLLSAVLLHDHDHHGHADHDHEAELEEARDHDHHHDHDHDQATTMTTTTIAPITPTTISAPPISMCSPMPSPRCWRFRRWSRRPISTSPGSIRSPGFLGMIVITVWAYSLIKSAAAVLLDAVPSRSRAGLIRQRLEIESDRVTDLHVWRLGPGHLGVLAVIVSEHPRAPDYYKARLAGIEGLSHVSIEVNPYMAPADDRLRSSGGASP